MSGSSNNDTTTLGNGDTVGANRGTGDTITFGNGNQDTVAAGHRGKVIPFGRRLVDS